MLKMSIGPGCYSLPGICQKWCLYPTLVYWTTDYIISKEFLELPDSILFYIFVLPYCSPN